MQNSHSKPAIKSKQIKEDCPLCNQRFSTEILDGPEFFIEPEAWDISELRTRRYCKAKGHKPYKLYD